jgi:hypothetical protein
VVGLATPRQEPGSGQVSQSKDSVPGTWKVVPSLPELIGVMVPTDVAPDVADPHSKHVPAEGQTGEL